MTVITDLNARRRSFNHSANIRPAGMFDLLSAPIDQDIFSLGPMRPAPENVVPFPDRQPHP